ncbi:MAG: hypothetical protein R3F48_01420 [Candidatus Zixiibacteriota bacterium]
MGKKKDKTPKPTIHLKKSGKTPDYQQLKKSIPYHQQKPVFSFLDCDLQNKEYKPGNITNDKIWHKFIQRLTNLSNLTWGEIERFHDYHAHPFSWNQASVNCHTKCFHDYPPYQFAIDRQPRIIGFFDRDSIFHIVWFDKDHTVFPGK